MELDWDILSQISISNVAVFSFTCVVAEMTACHMMPALMTLVMSQPYANQIQWNLGPTSLEFQVVLYTVYHGASLGIWSHYTIAIDLLAWLVVIGAKVNRSTMVFTCILLCAQVLTFKDKALSKVAVPLYMAYTAAADYCIRCDGAASWAQGLICITAIIRCFAHAVEKYPPYMLSNSRGWVPAISHVCDLNFFWRLISSVAGYLSDMSAGVPGRLFPEIIHFIQLRNGHRRSTVISTQKNGIYEKQYSMDNINNVASLILGRKLWQAYGPTSKMFATEIEKDSVNGPRQMSTFEFKTHMGEHTPLLPLADAKLIDKYVHAVANEKSGSGTSNLINHANFESPLNRSQDPHVNNFVLLPTLTDIPKFWRNIFMIEIPIVLITCVYWVLSPDYYVRSIFGVSSDFTKYSLLLQSACIAFYCYAWFYSRILTYPRHTDLYMFCDLQEAMAIGDVVMVTLGLMIRDELAGKLDSLVTVYAQIAMASLWLGIRLRFLADHDVRTSEPRPHIYE